MRHVRLGYDRLGRQLRRIVFTLRSALPLFLLTGLASACFSLMLHPARAESYADARQFPGRTQVLTRIDQVHRLDPEEAALGLPVHLRGVVTVSSAWRDAFFLEDPSGGIALERAEHSPLQAGELVEVTGISQSGGFAPLVLEQKIRVLGPGTLPSSRVYNYPELAGGLKDSEWVEVEGVVQAARVRSYWSRMILELKVGVPGGSISVRVLHYQPGDEAGLLDAKVHLRGVCGSVFNDKRQLTGILMYLNSLQQLQVLRPAPADPYAIVLSPLNSIMQFKPGRAEDHRIRIAGTVTYQDFGKTLYVQDGADGLLIETEQQTRVPLGTSVEVIGFPGLGGYSPLLRNALFRVLGPGKPLTPVPIRANAFFTSQATRSYDSETLADAPYNAQLVRVQGVLLESRSRLNGRTWLLQNGKDSFPVVLRQDAGAPDALAIEKGSLVAATGIFSVQVDEDNQPQSFHVLLRGPEDIVVLKRASWWSPGHALGVLAALLAATLGITLWTMLLRQRVRHQTRMLRESEERFRKQAQQDALTGLASRSYLQEQMRAAIDRARARGERLGVLMIDLDHFKQVNDTLGHHVGDELLCAVAARIRQSVRKSDLVARMGGDEFIVLLADLYDSAEAELIAAKVVANVSTPVSIVNRQVFVSASVGVCMYPESGADGESLFKNVDAAMYKAKCSGRNSLSVYTSTRCASAGKA